MRSFVGTAGWSIASGDAAAFPADGTALQRYARVFDGVEINSSFYRPHRASTWARWAASVPEHFRFSVKIPKAITHEARLIDSDDLIAQFAREVQELGSKLAVLLVQLPPSLGFVGSIAEAFFRKLRAASDVAVVCEPRHFSWFGPEAEAMFVAQRVARVAADPGRDDLAGIPGGWPGLRYRRLHGSPTLYRSAYGAEALSRYARQICAELDAGVDSWCILDNTAASAATGNALSLAADIRRYHAVVPKDDLA